MVTPSVVSLGEKSGIPVKKKNNMLVFTKWVDTVYVKLCSIGK